MTKEEMLKRAKQHCFFIGLNDSGAELCRANSVYGIAAIHYIQEQIGLPPDATFITTPDMTITRNTTRWKSGFGYGGKITWGSGHDELVILNTKPNACGMLVGGLESFPAINTLLERLHRMDKETTVIDGIEVQWDFYKSNHFIDLFFVKPVAKTGIRLPTHAFIIHGSAGEFNGDNARGFGLYYDKSKKLKEIAGEIDTPFGQFYILTGDAAKRYYETYQVAEAFSKKKREMAAKILFENFTVISNECHQGLSHMNEILLGCNQYRNDDRLFPLALRGDLPAYLVSGCRSLRPECIELLGFEKRSKRLGVYERLLNANIFPHGGGYNLPDVLSVNRVIEIDDERYFDVEMQNDRGKKIISEVRELPYEYRGRTVVLRALETGLIEIVAKLIPQYVFKI
ncbi:MAG: hypothetical protein JW881_22075 [Spirochaetales bacterium]|nr:hypothetical protein [Spirochaetales bacterium]